jgi:hypothetical protein
VVQKADRQKVFRFGAEHFPAETLDFYKWQPGSEEANFKGIQVFSAELSGF